MSSPYIFCYSFKTNKTLLHRSRQEIMYTIVLLELSLQMNSTSLSENVQVRNQIFLN